MKKGMNFPINISPGGIFVMEGVVACILLGLFVSWLYWFGLRMPVPPWVTLYNSALWLRDTHPTVFNFLLITFMGACGGSLLSLQPSDPLLPNQLPLFVQAAFGACAAYIGCNLVMNTATTTRNRIIAASIVFGFCGLVVMQSAQTAIGLSPSDKAKGQISSAITEADNLEKEVDANHTGDDDAQTIERYQLEAIRLIHLAGACGDNSSALKANAYVVTICSRLAKLSEHNPADVASCVGPILESASIYQVRGLIDELQKTKISAENNQKIVAPSVVNCGYIRWLNFRSTDGKTFEVPDESSLFDKTPGDIKKLPLESLMTAYTAKTPQAVNAALKLTDYTPQIANTDINVHDSYPVTYLDSTQRGKTIGTISQGTHLPDVTGEKLIWDAQKQSAQLWVQVSLDKLSYSKLKDNTP